MRIGTCALDCQLDGPETWWQDSWVLQCIWTRWDLTNLEWCCVIKRLLLERRREATKKPNEQRNHKSL